MLDVSSDKKCSIYRQCHFIENNVIWIGEYFVTVKPL